MINPQESYAVRPASERAHVVDDNATEAVGSSRIRIKREESGGFQMITCVSLFWRVKNLQSKQLFTSHVRSIF